MADTLRIKRRPVGGAAGPPATLASAEIAFNEQDNTLYYGKGNSGGIATSIISIGGSGGYLPLSGGTLTGDLIVNAEIGINTTPVYPLDIRGNITTNAIVYNNAQQASTNTTVQYGMLLTQDTTTSATLTDYYGMRYSGTLLGTAAVTTYTGIGARLNLPVGFTGTVNIGYTFAAEAPINSTSPVYKPYNTYAGFVAFANTNGHGVTTGTINNRGFWSAAMTAASAGTATVNNEAIRAQMPTGSPAAGTTTNYGIFIGGTIGGTASGTGIVKNWSIMNNTQADVLLSDGGRVAISNGGGGSNIPLALLHVGGTDFPGTARSYRGYTDSLNYDGAYMGDWSGTLVRYGSVNAGSFSTARDVSFVRSGVEQIGLTASGVTTSTSLTVTGNLTASGALVVGANAFLTHQLKMYNDTALYIYNDVPGETVIEALQASAPATKHVLALNKYGGFVTALAVRIDSIATLADLNIGTTANPGTARTYNGYSNSTNYDLAYMGDWSGNVARYGTANAGTFATARDVSILRGGVEAIRIDGTYVNLYRGLNVSHASWPGAIIQNTGAASLPAIILNSTITGYQHYLYFQDAGVGKFQVGKGSDNSWFMWDNTNGANFLTVNPTGQLNLGESNQIVITKTGGVAISNGATFGGVLGASSSDLSKHISLHSAGYGFGITSGRLNYVVATGGTHMFVVNAVDVASVSSTGIFGAIGTTVPSTGAFTTVTMTGALTLRSALAARTYLNYTSPTDGTWGYMGDWVKAANVCTYGTDKAGATGVNTSVSILTSGVEALRINTAQEFGFNLGGINPTYIYDFGGATTSARVFSLMTTQTSSGSGVVRYLYLGPVVTVTNATSVANINGVDLDLFVSGTTPSVVSVNGVISSLILQDTFTGTVTSGRGFVAQQTPNNRPGAMTAFYGFHLGSISNGQGLTTGILTNRGFNAGNAITAATGVGTGIINNQAVLITLPTGSPTGGTTNNYGLYITGNGGTVTGGIVNNWAVWNNSTSPVYLSAGNVGIQNTTPQVSLHVGTTGGTARVYNNFTDGLNGEWAYIGDWFANVARYGTDYNGTFSISPRDVSFVRHGAEQLRLTSAGPTFGAGAVVSQPVPTLIGSATLAANSRSVVVMGNYAYTTNQGVTPTHVLEIWDITTSTPIKVGGLDLPIGALGQMALAGHILYIPINSGTVGLQIVDVSNPKAPLLLRSQTSGSASCAVLSGGYLYTGLINGTFRCYDVSDPSLPIIKSTTAILSGSTGVVAMALQGKYAYAVGTQTVAGVGGLNIIDISDPASMTTVATYNTPSSGRGITVAGKYAYISGAITATGLEVVDISDPSAPVQVAIVSTAAASNYTAPIIAGKYLYLTCNASIRILDISNPAAPVAIGSVTVTANASGAALSGNRLYVTGAPGNLYVYETYGIDTPTLKSGSLNTDRLYVDGDSYFAGEMYAQRGLMVGQAGIFSRGPIMTDTSLGAIPISAVFGTGLVCIGGNDPTFPAFKRAATTVQVRLGDDSGYAGLGAGTVFVGPTATALNVGATTQAFQVYGASTEARAAFARFSADTAGFIMGFAKSRGTPTTPGIVVSGDDIGTIHWYADDGTLAGATNKAVASIAVTSVGTVSSSAIPAFMDFYTANAAGTRARRFRIGAEGGVNVGGTTDPGFGNLTLNSGNLYFINSGVSGSPMLKRSLTELQTRLGDDTAYAPLSASVMAQAANEQGARIEFRSLTELTTIAAAATTSTAIQIPANAVVLSVSLRVVTLIPTAANFTIGVTGTPARYGTGILVAAGTTSPGTLAGPLYYAAATSILITPNATPATATGQVRVNIHYYLVTPPAS